MIVEGLFTWFLKKFPTENVGILAAGIYSFSPLLGFLPYLAFLSLASN